jgi:hypothetical protein
VADDEVTETRRKAPFCPGPTGCRTSPGRYTRLRLPSESSTWECPAAADPLVAPAAPPAHPRSPALLKYAPQGHVAVPGRGTVIRSHRLARRLPVAPLALEEVEDIKSPKGSQGRLG